MQKNTDSSVFVPKGFVMPMAKPGGMLLGRPLGHFIFSLIGFKRILHTSIFQGL